MKLIKPFITISGLTFVSKTLGFIRDVLIASMIGVKGLGVPILRAINNQYLALGLMNGLAIVALAIIFDRISQHFGKRIQNNNRFIR